MKRVTIRDIIYGDILKKNKSSDIYLLTREEVEEYEIYKNLKEQNKLVELPCKVGDVIWDNDFGSPCAYTISAFSFGECEDYIDKPVTNKEIIFYYSNSNGSITGSFAESEIGKTVFLTRAEAEAKIKEMRCNNE